MGNRSRTAVNPAVSVGVFFYGQPIRHLSRPPLAHAASRLLLLEEGVEVFELAHHVDFHVFDGGVINAGAEFFDESVENLIGFKVAKFLFKIIMEHGDEFLA